MITEPEDPDQHQRVLVNLMRRLLTSGNASFFRAMSLTLETERTDLIVNRTVLTLNDEEIAVLAIENNRVFADGSMEGSE